MEDRLTMIDNVLLNSHQEEWHVSSSVCQIRRHLMLPCPVTDDVDPDPWMKAMSVRFLHYKVTICLFIINKYLVRRYFETMHLLGFSSYLYLANFSTHHWLFAWNCSPVGTCQVAVVHLVIISVLISGDSNVRKNLLFHSEKFNDSYWYEPMHVHYMGIIDNCGYLLLSFF